MIGVVARLTIKAGEEENFKTAMRGLAEAVRSMIRAANETDRAKRTV